MQFHKVCILIQLTLSIPLMILVMMITDVDPSKDKHRYSINGESSNSIYKDMRYRKFKGVYEFIEINKPEFLK